MNTVAKFLIEDLYSKGVDTFFGIPGGPIGPLFAGIYKTNGAKLIESKHETAAVFEAIGYYKSTGKIPVVLLTAGPGITNALTGIASAKALRIPILVICGDVSWETKNHIMLQTGGKEGIDIEETFAAHTDKIIRCKDKSLVSQEVIGLLSTRNNLAPSMIVLPLYISNSEIEKPIINNICLSQNNYLINKEVLSDINILIKQSKHPLMIIGYGARNSVKEVSALVDNLNIPFATTPQAKGFIDETHPLSLRHVGLGASNWIKKYLETKPDVVLVLGSDLDDCSIGTTEFVAEDTKLIHIDINHKVFNRKYKTDIAIFSDIKTFCNQFDCEKHSDINLDNIKSLSPFDVESFYKDEAFPIAPHRVLADLEKASPTNSRFITDIGEHMLFCLHYLTINKDKEFSIDLGLGSMGSGICQSIGMCLADKKPTICICGDGCFQMHGMEILVAIKHKLPIVFVVFNDARYNMVSHGFNFSFNIKEEPGKTNYIDFAKIAESFDIPGIRIEKPGEITTDLINGLLNNNSPSILDVRINKEIRLQGAGRNEVLKHMGE